MVLLRKSLPIPVIVNMVRHMHTTYLSNGVILLMQLPHYFSKLQPCRVFSIHLAITINSIMHNASSNARSHSKQRSSQSKAYSKYEVSHTRSHKYEACHTPLKSPALYPKGGMMSIEIILL